MRLLVLPGRAVLALASLWLVSVVAVASQPDLPGGWRATVLADIRASEYHFGPRPDGAWSAPNRAQSLRSFVTAEDGLRLVPRTDGADPWELGLKLTGTGRGASLVAPVQPRLSAEGNRVERQTRNLTEWFVNEPRGIEHGFTLFAPPADDLRSSPLTLELSVTGDLRAELTDDRLGLAFLTSAGRQVVTYDSLYVVDARGDRLEATFELSGDRLRIVVDDRGAVYPVVVDPLVTVPDWLDTSAQSNALLGISVAGAGDLDGDGFDDVIVGAEEYNNDQTDEGAVFVYLGSPGGPDTSPSWHAEGDHPAGRFGRSIAGAGDVNNDGYDDVIIGAPEWDDTSDPDEGAVFAFYGSPNALNPLLLRPVGRPSNADWRAEGDDVAGEFGIAVASAGDVNNDGADDIIIGARSFTNDQSIEGSAFVFHGSNDPDGLALPGATRPVGHPGDADWTGESNKPSSLYGHAVASAGDVNADGYDDVLVGAPELTQNDFKEGRAYLYLGGGSGVQSAAIWTRDGGANEVSFGISVASAGDVDGDGLDDVVIGAEDWTNGQEFEGAAFLFRGAPGGALQTTPDWTVEINQGDAALGSAVGAADVNSDGFSDVLVGARKFTDGDPEEGAVFVYMGSPTGPAATPTITFEINEPGSDFGSDVSSAGDVNGDGIEDVLVGASDYQVGGGAFIFFGCEDDDRDGVCQVVDNCAGLVNPDQDDADSDGIGDACDPCEDVDADTVCDKPRVLVESSGPGEKVLVQHGSPIRFLVNTFVNPGLGLTWTLPSYDDQNPPWADGLYGIGYEEPPAGAPVGASDLLVTTGPPSQGAVSVYTRADFCISAGTVVDTLFLGVDYDDAYVAWINGVEVFRSSQMPAGAPDWNTDPVSGHESSNASAPDYTPLQNISLTGIPVLNVGGCNTLAVGVWNTSPNSSDLVLVPRLSINRPLTSTMRYLANSAPDGLNGIWRLTSFNDESWTPGNYGVGYETGTGAEELLNSEVPSAARSVFTRARFTVSVSSVQSLFLGADWDDGYAAWINGQEVFRSPQITEPPQDPPVWDWNPTEHESSNGAVPDYGTLEDITFVGRQALFDGVNVLAIGVWGSDPGGLEDLVLVPRLSINEGSIDNCIGVANPTQSDVDADGLGDACDPDIDDDTILNESDNCPSVANVTQDDCDVDDVGDPCDICPCDASDDADSDGICAGAGFNSPKTGDMDNCPSDPNPFQEDANGDGEGDACDPDIDGDGEPNGTDNCVYDVNPDQTDIDGDTHGAVCDCDDSLATGAGVWRQPEPIDTLTIARADLCVNFTCTESLGACGDDGDCLFDTCANFACTETFSACDTNADCLQDKCTNFTCSVGGNGCVNNGNCTADFCANKSCTLAPFSACTTDSNCVGDACTNKFCTEPPFAACTSSSQCVNSPSDICVGSCSVGMNACVSDLACTMDRCEGGCSVGANTCVDDSVCTQDVCEGTCSVSPGPITCVDDTPCTAPQTDLCKGTCSIGGNVCPDTVCDDPQTDVCRGTCSLSDGVCVNDQPCTLPAVDTLRWQPPQVLGAAAVSYDTLRSLDDTDFITATTCVESDPPDDLSDTQAQDVTLPLVTDPVLYYLIRIENACPASTMGSQSNGTPRTGRTCP